MDRQFQFESWYFDCRKLNYLMELRKHQFPTSSLCFNVYEYIGDIAEHVIDAEKQIWSYESKGLQGDFSWVPLQIDSIDFSAPNHLLPVLQEIQLSQSAVIWVYRDKLDYVVPEGAPATDVLHSLYVDGVRMVGDECQLHIHDMFPEYKGWVRADCIVASIEGMSKDYYYAELLKYEKNHSLHIERLPLWQAFSADILQLNNDFSAYEKFLDIQADWNERYGSHEEACHFLGDTWSFLAGSRYLTQQFLQWIGYEGPVLDRLNEYVRKALIIRNFYLKSLYSGKKTSDSIEAIIREIALVDEQALTLLKQLPTDWRGPN
ncbi:hypothetical protein [Paenibacillus arenosi]|uniref:Butirosin biosynthesis protein H N-terminal domain-containing protein n=1 Tax=Paenibacillus arenosi TaxID=2774142 RepID=A0ABR9ASS2_9BACL|nr:hypothetical protein [Paenibacillus arenosi]MBD8496931.1 hypothetical protein [Paenibacillus arenosi]